MPDAVDYSKFPPIYVIYDHPSDYPNSFVCKRWFGELQDDRFLIVSPNVDVVRYHMLELWLTKLTRHPDDDPVILETWL